MKTKQGEKVLSLFLAVCMVFAILPTVAFAEIGDVDSRVPLGVGSIITDFAPLDKSVAQRTVEVGTGEEELKLPNELMVAVEIEITATDSDAQKEITESTVSVSGWTSDPTYDGDREGVYTFTPTLNLPEKLMLSEDITLPTITVTVEQEVFEPMARGTTTTVTGKLYMDGAEVVSDLGVDEGNLGTNGWAWDAATATLTLTSGYTGGRISIGCDYGKDTVNLVFTGPVTIDAPASDSYAAISCQGHLNVSGSGTLSLTSLGSPLYVVGDLCMTSGTVTAETTGENRNGIFSQGGSITISDDANVIGSGTGTGDSYGIRTQNGPLTISTTGTVTATGKVYGVYGTTTTISGGTVRLNGSNTKPDDSGETVISGGTVIYNGGTPPVITNIFPNSGEQAGGTSVVITGTNLTGATVKIGGIEAVDVVAKSATEITCTVPTGSVGSAHVLVETPDGATALTSGFTYTPGGNIFFDTASSTFNLTYPPIGNGSGGSGSTAWTWNYDEKKLTLVGVGPYTLTGTASGEMRVVANIAADLTLSGAQFTSSTGYTALYLSQGGTLRVPANCDLTGSINSGTRTLEIILSNDALLQVIDNSGFSCLSTWGLALSGRGRVTATSTTGLGVMCAGDLVVGAGCTLEATGGRGIAFQGAPTIRGSGKIVANGGTYCGIACNSATDSLAFNFTGDLEIRGNVYGIDVQKAGDTEVRFTGVPRSLYIQGTNGIIGSSSGGTFTLQNTGNISGISEAVNSGATVFSGRFYALTVRAGTGGSITTGADGASLREGDIFSVGANANSGYAFSGWSSSDGGGFGDPTSAATTFTMPAAATTITANFTYTGGVSGSGGSGGGGSYTKPPTPPQAPPYQPVTATTPVTATEGANGTANVNIPANIITRAIAKAQADAKAQGSWEKGISVELNVTMPQGATSLTATIPQSALQSLVTSGINQLEVNGAPVSLGLNQSALQSIQNQASDGITIGMTPATVLSPSAQSMIGNRPVYHITISYTDKDGKTQNITSFGSGTATLAFPYTPRRNEVTSYLFGVYVDEKGNPSRIPRTVYDTNSRRILIPTNHLSVYGVGYTAPSAQFTDVVNHWAKESIDYVVGRGLLSGTSETAFTPNTAMTRGMLVTALARLAGIDTKTYTKNSFTDVKTDSPYRPYIEWAYSRGVVQGIGNNQFAPDWAVTREEIAVIFANYAKATGYKVPVTCTATPFADTSSIGGTYKDAVKEMQQAGIVMGQQNNKFNPMSNATRAEVSSMLHRYIKLTIDPATAQGWVLNNDGQYMYYKDGKPLTGWQTIDGMKYFFNTDGTLKSSWVKDGDNWRYYFGNKATVGWLDMGEKRYYFTKDGLMVSGKWLQIDSKWHYFNADGSLAKSTKVGGYEVDENGVRKSK